MKLISILLAGAIFASNPVYGDMWSTLSPQSGFSALVDAGIEMSLQTQFEILAGVRLLLAGKSHSTVNGILIEDHEQGIEKGKANIEFLSEVQRDKNSVRANFYVIGKENIIFEIEYNDTQTEERTDTKKQAGRDISVEDAVLREHLPMEQLNWGNVCQENDRICINKIAKTKKYENWITKHISGKISKFPQDEESLLIRNLWQQAIDSPDNAVVSTILELFNNGVKKQSLCRLIDVLLNLGIDPTNPWTACYHISDILGYMSVELLGEDLSSYKNIVRMENTNSTITTTQQNSTITRQGKTDILATLKREYEELRNKQKKLILSEKSFDVIYKEVALGSNTFVEKVINQLLPVVWNELGVSSDSSAVIYFRDMKTFSSDVDLYYWGPQPDKVNLMLTELLFSLGFKRDLWSTLLMGNEIENRRIDFDIYHYFAMGQIIEINEGSYSEVFNRDVESHLDLDGMWAEVHPYLCRQLQVWQGKPSQLPLDIKNIKKLQFRGISNLIFGLSNKFGINFGPDFDEIISRLESFITPEETESIRTTIVLANQTRNILQIVSQRRWENADEGIWGNIENIMARQKVPNLTQRVKELGLELENIRNKYFGEPDFRETKYLPLYTDERSKKTWKVLANRYKEIVDRKIEKQTDYMKSTIIKPENNDERYLLTRTSRILQNQPTNMYIDLTSLPEKQEQLEQNIKRLALIITRNNAYGLNMRYGFKGKDAARVIDLVKNELRNIDEFPNDKIESVFKLHTRAEAGDGLIDIRLENLDDITKDRIIDDREYVVALKDASTKQGVAVPNYTAAAVMGASLAALRVAWDKVPEKQKKGSVVKDKESREWEEYEELRGETMDKFTEIYERYGVNLIEGKSKFSVEELELMVNGCSKAKLYYVDTYALPPAFKAVDGAQEFHELEQLYLQQA